MPRGPIRVSLEQLRIAAKKLRRRSPACHDEYQKVMDALEPAGYHIAPLYKYVKAHDECIAKAKFERERTKPTTLHALSKYLYQQKNKTK